jgi:hypothetical protein
MMITISILYNKAKIQALSLVESHGLLEDRRAELRHTQPYPIEFKGAVNRSAQAYIPMDGTRSLECC